MIKEAYKFVEIKKDERFVFQSEGPQGLIVKIVQFTFEGNDVWNLGFGDFKKGTIDDSVMTNNHDVIRVIRTVANIAYAFLKRRPETTIRIRPVDEKRKKLYNLVFQRYFKEIEPVFEVKGWINQQEELYSPAKYYERFELKFK